MARGTPDPPSLSARLARAIRLAREHISQTALADAVEVDQPSVSKWERGEQRPSLEQIAAVETATGRRPGFVLIAAGLVETPSVEAALAADSHLDDVQRQFVLHAYRAGVTLSKVSKD
jgi:transcriptional regulator with XRE-family HTH domain